MQALRTGLTLPTQGGASLHFDGGTLVIDIQDGGFGYARLVFGSPVWFRVLDERHLCDLWPAYSEPNGWLWEVQEGGWLELEGCALAVQLAEYVSRFTGVFAG